MMGKMFNIPDHKLPAKMLANRAVLSAMTGRPGPAAEAIANANAHLNDAGLATYDEAREALAGMLELAELLAANSFDRVDVTSDEQPGGRLARARAVLAT
jgi:hypothetical protein